MYPSNKNLKIKIMALSLSLIKTQKEELNPLHQKIFSLISNSIAINLFPRFSFNVNEKI